MNKNTPIWSNACLIIFLFLSFNINVVFSEDNNDNSALSISTFNMFRDPSYILFGSGIGNMKPLIFEADLIPYYMLSINRNVKWGIQLSPRIILRMYNKYSYPVRTPSFMPRATFFYQLIDNENQKRDLFAYCSWFHHSNGQDGNFYNVDSVSINTTSGSFSTNWVEAGIFLSRPDPNLSFNTNFLKFSVAYNYQYDENLTSIYSHLRIYSEYQSSVNLSKVFEILLRSDNSRNFVINQSLRLGWIAGKIDNMNSIDAKRFNLRYTFTFKLSFLREINLFVQYYYGQDYYNIYFNQTLNSLRFGISSKASLLN